MLTLTNSAAKTYRACHKLFFFEYVEGYRPVSVAPELRTGTLGHRGLERLWLTRDIEDACAAIDAHSLALGLDDFEREKSRRLMVGYAARWNDSDVEQYDVLGVEEEFEGPLVNPETGAASKTWRVGGKLDAIVRERSSGRIYLVEHKTSSEAIGPGSDYWARLTLDPQISNYLAGARWLAPRLGFNPQDVAGVLYDVIGKPAIRPLTATPAEERKYTKPTKQNPEPRLYANQRETDETPEEFGARVSQALAADPDRYFRRGEVVRLESEVREAAQDLWQTAVQIKDARRLKLWSRNPDACMRYGRRCPFLDVCLRQASLDDDTRFRRAATMNEELSNNAA